MKKAFLILTLAVLFWDCENNKQATQKVKARNVVTSGCIADASSNLKLNMLGDTIFVTHDNLVLNCGMQALIVQTRVSNDTLYVNEQSDNNDANCVCSFNVNYELYPIPNPVSVLYFESNSIGVNTK